MPDEIRTEMDRLRNIQSLIEEFADTAARDAMEFGCGHPGVVATGIVIDTEDELALQLASHLAEERASVALDVDVLTLAGPQSDVIEFLQKIEYQEALALFDSSTTETNVLVIVMAEGRATGVHVDTKKFIT